MFKPSDHIRSDWDSDHLIESLEKRARGYSGLLREVLCSAAEQIRRDQRFLKAYRDELDARGQRMNDPVDYLLANFVSDTAAEASEPLERVQAQLDRLGVEWLEMRRLLLGWQTTPGNQRNAQWWVEWIAGVEAILTVTERPDDSK